ncbi:cytochrome P450 [Parasphingorhabdus pacifica]
MPTTTEPAFPPGPTGSTGEQLERFNQDPFGRVLELEREHGTIFTLRLGGLGNEELVDIDNNGHWVFLSRPHQIKAMYSADAETISGAQANALFFGTNEKSVSYLDGKDHRYRRSQILPSFSGGRDYVSIISSAIDRNLSQWPRETPFALFPALQKLTSEIIVEIVCGNFDELDRVELAALMPRIENAHNTLDDVLEADGKIRSFVDARIDGHLVKSDEAGRDDVLATLLRFAADGDASLTREVVRDEVFSLLFTGFSTTANTLSWAFLRILHHEDVYEELLRELGEDFRERPLRREAFSSRKYLEATIMEVLRLHPVSALNGVRMLREPLEIDGHLIPAKTILVHCAYLLQRSPEVYDEPERFTPERFMETSVSPYVWGAFGGGERTCPGRNYSREEMKIVLAMALSELRIEPVGEFPTSQQQGIFMAPEDHAQVVIRDR